MLARLRSLSALSLPIRVSLIGTLLLALACAGTVGLILRDVDAEMARRAATALESNLRLLRQTLADEGGGEGFAVVDGRLRVGSHIISGDDPAVDRVRSIIGGAATVFLGDTRIATNVTKPDGSRAVGTKLAAGPIYETVLRQGKPYRGEADILGVPYFTAYEPFQAADGSTLGILFTGVKQADYLAVIAQMQGRAILTGLALALVCSLLLWVWLRRTVGPLSTLR